MLVCTVVSGCCCLLPPPPEEEDEEEEPALLAAGAEPLRLPAPGAGRVQVIMSVKTA